MRGHLRTLVAILSKREERGGKREGRPKQTNKQGQFLYSSLLILTNLHRLSSAKGSKH